MHALLLCKKYDIVCFLAIALIPVEYIKNRGVFFHSHRNVCVFFEGGGGEQVT